MDQDFLFGVFAVQLGFATPSQVMAAAAAWLADRSQTIPQRLAAEGVIDESKRSLLATFVADALKLHEGNVEQTLQTLGGEQALYRSFGGSLQRDPQGQVSIQIEDAPVSVGDGSGESAAVTAEHPSRYTPRGGSTTAAEIGRGGLGRVMVVFDEHLGREVAIKELLADVGSSVGTPASSRNVSRTSALAARFLREARVTGQLEHPSIVPVYEVGQRADGTYYYAMRLVRGRTLAAALEPCRSLSDRLALLPHYVNLCHAIAYAHSRGVVHRDIKPDNVMIGEFGETVVVDWGLAKVRGKKDIRGKEIERELALYQEAGSGHTVDGSAIGTPAYMSPEQADGAIDEIDERSDVWSLGAVLYEILTGRPPFEGVTPFEIMGKVLKDPVLPPRQVSEAIPAELSAVAQKALARKRQDRYPRAGELAAEIEAYMSGGRIAAYEYSSWELLQSFVRRNKVPSALALVILLLSVAGSVVLYRAYRNAEVQRARAEQNEARAADEEQQARASERSAQLHLAVGLRDKAQLLLSRRDALGARVFAAASLLHNPHNSKSPQYPQAGGDQDPRARHTFVEAYSLYYQASLSASVRLRAVLRHDGAVNAVALSPNGKLMASGGDAAGIQIWDAAEGKLLRTLEGAKGTIRALDFSPDGALLGVGDKSGAVQLWSTADYSMRETHHWHEGWVSVVRFDPSSSRLVTVSGAGRAVLYDLESKQLQEVAAPLGNWVFADFSKDGGLLAVPEPGQAKQVRLWNVATNRTQEIAAVGLTTLTSVAFSPIRPDLAAGGLEQGLYVWDLDSSERRGVLAGHQTQVGAVRYMQSGRMLVSGGLDAMRIWDGESLALVQTVAGHQGSVTGLAVDERSRLIASSSTDRTVKLWQVDGTQRVPRFASPQAGYRSAFSPDGSKLAKAGKRPCIWDRSSGDLLHQFDAQGSLAEDIEFSPDGSLVASGTSEGALHLWEVATGRQRARWLEPGAYFKHVAWSPDGRSIASADPRSEQAMVWDVASGEVRLRLEGSGSCVAYSPDGKLLAAANRKPARGIRLWNAHSGALERSLEGDFKVDHVAISPDGRWLAATGYRGEVALWDLQGEGVAFPLEGHSKWVNEASFSPDGKLLATGSDDRTARIWSVEQRDTIMVLRVDGPCSTAFAPDGKWLAVSSSQAQLFPVELSIRHADPQELLEQAQREAGQKLDGFALVPVD